MSESKDEKTPTSVNPDSLSGGSKDGKTTDRPAARFLFANEPVNAQFLFTKDEFLKYLDMDLWARFRPRLWGSVIALLTLGLFGINYYVQSQINERLSKTEVEFTRKRDEILRTAKLLSVANTIYETKRLKLVQDIYYLLQGMEDYEKKNSSLTDSDLILLGRIKRQLMDLAGRGEYSNLLRNSPDQSVFNISGGLSKIPVVPKRAVVKRFDTESTDTVGNNSLNFFHPIYDGSLGGALKDIKFQIYHLKYYHLSIEDFQNHLITLGANTNEEKRFDRSSLEALYEETINKLYEENIQKAKEKDFNTDDSDLFYKYKGWYVIQGIKDKPE